MFRTEHRPVLLHRAPKENTSLFSFFPQAKPKQCGFSRARPPQPLMEGPLLPPVTLKTKRTQNSTQLFPDSQGRPALPVCFHVPRSGRGPCTAVSECDSFLVWWMTKRRLREGGDMTLVTQHSLGCDGNTSHHQTVTSLLGSGALSVREGASWERAGLRPFKCLFLSPAAKNARPEP